MNAIRLNQEPNYPHEFGRAARAEQSIAICEANPILADGIRRLFQSDRYLSQYNISIAYTDNFSQLKTLAPDILIIDPGQRTEVPKIVSEAFLELSHATALIGYCTDTSSVEARALVALGFRGVMPKTVSGEDFVRIVCAVAFGGICQHESYDKARNSVDVPPVQDIIEKPDLTVREFEVLRHLALGSPMKEIASLLKISAKTVDTYKNRANRKLNLRSRSDIVRYAIQSGWMH